MDEQRTIPSDVLSTVERALREDLGNGDLTAQLIASNLTAAATVKCRQEAVLCGIPWFQEAFRLLNPAVIIEWNLKEGDQILTNQTVCHLSGNAQAMLSAERTALNFLQTLSATATTTREYVCRIAHTDCKVLDTRKTLPGLRNAQKYAVRIGGGTNHRHGLYDGILLKENHQFIDAKALGKITNELVENNLLLEVEIERLDQLEKAIASKANRVMLDNFSLPDVKEAVRRANGRVQLEASGNFNLDNITEVAETGVDYISIGALTKNVSAVDFSMRVQPAR